MAAKKVSKQKALTKKTPNKIVAKVTLVKPIKETLGKTGLIAHIAASSEVDAKLVRKVIAGLEGAIVASISKKGAGAFMMPGFFKVSATKVAAKPKRKDINRFTGLEQVFAAKPASLNIKVRALKKLKDAAA